MVFQADKKDDVHRLGFTGPDKAQPLSAGLPMNVSLTYGPSGGKLTGTVQTEILAGLEAYQGIYHFSGLKKTQPVYTVKAPAQSRFNIIRRHTVTAPPVSKRPFMSDRLPLTVRAEAAWSRS